MIQRVPVIPGPDEAALIPRLPVEPMPDCVACGYGTRNGVLRSWWPVANFQLALCVDWQACCARFRQVRS